MSLDLENLKAGSFVRFLAAVIDLFFITAMGLILFKLNIVDIIPLKLIPLLKSGVAAILIYVVYYVFPMGLFAQTIGCHLVGIKVVNKKLAHLGLKAVIRCTIGYLKLNFFGLFALLIGKASKIDEVTNTIVVKAKLHKKTKLKKLDYVLFWFSLIVTIGFPTGWLKMYHSKNINFSGLNIDIRKYQLVASDEFNINKIWGNVFYSRRMDRKKLTLNTVLRAQDSIITESKALAIITYKNDNFTNKFKIGPDSNIKLSQFQIKNKKQVVEGQHMLIDVGRTLIDVSNKTKQERVRVETKAIVLGVRGTRFIVDVDEMGTRVFVKEGIVHIFNKAKRNEVIVKANEYYKILNDGNHLKLKNNNYDIIWNFNENVDFLKIYDLKLEKVSSVDSSKKSKIQSLLYMIKTKLKKDIQYYKDKRKEVVSYEKTLKKVKLKLKDKNKIVQDLKCLKSSGTCQLNMENVLIKRGFPIIKFTSKLRVSMSNELKKYYKERKDERASLEVKIENTKRLVDREKKRLSFLSKEYKEIVKIKDLNVTVKNKMSDLVKFSQSDEITFKFNEVFNSGL